MISNTMISVDNGLGRGQVWGLGPAEYHIPNYQNIPENYDEQLGTMKYQEIMVSNTTKVKQETMVSNITDMEERGLSHHCPAPPVISVCVDGNDDYGNFHPQITLDNNHHVENSTSKKINNYHIIDANNTEIPE